MHEVFQTLIHALEEGRPAVLVTIVASSGSTPRGTGAMMAVLEDGTSAGSIGGGNVEFEAQKQAAVLLQTGENALRSFRFVQGESVGMVCGGDVTLHFHRLCPDDDPSLAALRRVEALSAAGNGAWLLRRLEGARVTQIEALALGQETHRELLTPKAVLTPEGWLSVPVEVPGRVYVFGGGHVSQELVRAITHLGFRTVVCDDRPEFADPERFPGAEQALCVDFQRIGSAVSLTAEDYVVVMTRGHQADYEVLAQVLRSGAKYIGCIGSRKKLALCRERLLAAGFTAEEYAAVHAPIGLAIGAETPAEIAVSVAAELIAVRAGVAVSELACSGAGRASCNPGQSCVQ